MKFTFLVLTAKLNYHKLPAKISCNKSYKGTIKNVLFGTLSCVFTLFKIYTKYNVNIEKMLIYRNSLSEPNNKPCRGTIMTIKPVVTKQDIPITEEHKEEKEEEIYEEEEYYEEG